MQRISSFAEQNPSMRVIVFIIGLSQEKRNKLSRKSKWIVCSECASSAQQVHNCRWCFYIPNWLFNEEEAGSSSPLPATNTANALPLFFEIHSEGGEKKTSILNEVKDLDGI